MSDQTTSDGVSPLTVVLTSHITPKTQIFMLMTLFGVASFLPWNLVITAHSFYVTNFSDDTCSDVFEIGFPSYIEMVGIFSYFLAALLAVFLLKRDNLVPVVSQCNIIAVLVLVLITVIAHSECGDWPFSSLLFGTLMFASSFSTSGMMALSSLLPISALRGLLVGQGAAGISTSLLCIVMLLTSDSGSAAFHFFLVAGIFLSLSLAGFIALSGTQVVQSAVWGSSRNSLEQAAEEEEAGHAVSVLSVFRTVWKACLTTLLASFMTSACFPAVLTLMRNSNEHTGIGSWVTSYFLPVTVYFVFSVGDVMGRVTASLHPLPCPDYLLCLAHLRILLVPSIFVSNLQPGQVHFMRQSEIWGPFFNLLLSWSHGHIVTLAAVQGSQRVVSKRGRTLVGTLLALFYVLGLLCGSLLVLPLVGMVKPEIVSGRQ